MSYQSLEALEYLSRKLGKRYGWDLAKTNAKESIDLIINLPLVGNSDNDIRLVNENKHVYFWWKNEWHDVGEVLLIDSEFIKDLPASMNFKEGVDTEANLPTVGNEVNDARITNDTGHLYVWNGTNWIDQGDIIDLDWSAISNKPTSAVIDIDDAVSKKHSQNLDSGLTTLDGTQWINCGIDSFANWDTTNIKIGTTINSGMPGAYKVRFHINITTPIDEDITLKITGVEAGIPDGNIIAAKTVRLKYTTLGSYIVTIILDTPVSLPTDCAIYLERSSLNYGIGSRGGNVLNYCSLITFDGINWANWGNADDFNFDIWGNGYTSNIFNSGVIVHDIEMLGEYNIAGRNIKADGIKLDTIESNAVSLTTVKADNQILDAINKAHEHLEFDIILIDGLNITIAAGRIDVDSGGVLPVVETIVTLLEGNNYIYIDETGVIQNSNSGFTNKGYHLYEIIVTAGEITSNLDVRPNGFIGHEVGKDQGLDIGGLNEVLVADIKNSVDISHTQNTDTKVACPSSEPADATLDNNEMTFWVDEGNALLKFKVKDSLGVIKSGSIALS